MDFDLKPRVWQNAVVACYNPFKSTADRFIISVSAKGRIRQAITLFRTCFRTINSHLLSILHSLNFILVITEKIAKFLKLDSLISHLTGFVETRIELLKFELKEDLSRVLSKVGVYVAIAFVVTFFLFFISMAVAYMLSEKVGPFWGFAIVGGFFILIGIILLIFRERLSKNLEKEIKELMTQKKK